uniref:Beta-arrestin-1 n=1 Tax=Hucho hucho TaxID=62062 RepID=A0A4W5QT88_9TELE
SKQGSTKCSKQGSTQGSTQVYLGKRDFVDHVDLVEPVETVYCERKLFVTLTCAFRYGREDLDVLGLTFRKDLFVANIQAFPPVPEDKKSLTRLQERLIKKLGEHAHPFTFEVNVVVVVIFVFSVVGFCCRTNSVRLVIRKVQYAPEKPGPQPMAETTRQFLMSDKPLHLEASLDKEIYYHGEPISVNVHVTNNTNKTVKKMKISVRQPHVTDLVLLITIDSCCSSDVVAPSSTFCKVYTLTPFLNNNREKRGLALDGKLKHEDTNLASSTLLLGDLATSDVHVELPFTLMHPKPIEDAFYRDAADEAPIDTNLIEFDTNDDDIIFEDFARQRLIGAKDDEDEEGTDSPKLNHR